MDSGNGNDGNVRYVVGGNGWGLRLAVCCHREKVGWKPNRER